MHLKLQNDQFRLTVAKDWLLTASSKALKTSSFVAGSSLGKVLTMKQLGLALFSDGNSGKQNCYTYVIY